MSHIGVTAAGPLRASVADARPVSCVGSARGQCARGKDAVQFDGARLVESEAVDRVRLALLACRSLAVLLAFWAITIALAITGSVLF